MSRRFRYDPTTDSVVEVGRPAGVANDWKPLHCETLAFDGDPEVAKGIDRQLGAPPVDYDKNNCPVFNDRSTYNKYLKAHGYVNQTSGKGNVQLTALDLERAIARAKEIDKVPAIAPQPTRKERLKRRVYGEEA